MKYTLPVSTIYLAAFYFWYLCITQPYYLFSFAKISFSIIKNFINECNANEIPITAYMMCNNWDFICVFYFILIYVFICVVCYCLFICLFIFLCVYVCILILQIQLYNLPGIFRFPGLSMDALSSVRLLCKEQ